METERPGRFEVDRRSTFAFRASAIFTENGMSTILIVVHLILLLGGLHINAA